MKNNTWYRSSLQCGAILLLAATAGLGINSLRTDGLSLSTDWSPAARMALASGENLLIPLEEAKDHFLARTALYLDARPKDTYDQGHIKGALNLPLEDLDDRYTDVVAHIPTDKLIITYCEGITCDLSEELARFLREDGFENVKVLADGWTVWRNAHLPVE